jgi:hypothetical protein
VIADVLGIGWAIDVVGRLTLLSGIVTVCPAIVSYDMLW